MIATNGGRARSKLRNRESLFARKRIINGCVTSRNVLLFVIVNDDNDNTSMKRKGASVRRRELRGMRGRKIRNLVFSLPRTRRFDSVSRTWAVFDENSKSSISITTGINFSGRSVRPSIIFPGVTTAGE